jgi:hypothetical protein
MPRHATKIVATLGPASSDPECWSADRRRRRGAAELQPRQGAGPHRPRRAGARGRRQTVGKPVALMADLQGPKIRVGKFAEGKVMLKPGAPSSWTRSAPSLGDITRGPGLQGTAARREARRHAAAQRRPDRADGDGRRASSAHRRQAGRRAVQQQGHQQAGRRPHGARADRQGHGGHQDRHELPVRLRGGELSQKRHRHGDGAPALPTWPARPSSNTSPA